jgi:hypothetical protein
MFILGFYNHEGHEGRKGEEKIMEKATPKVLDCAYEGSDIGLYY